MRNRVVLSLIAFALLVGAVQPIARASGRAHSHRSSNRVVVVSEPATDADPRATAPLPFDVHVAAAVSVALLLTVLKMRRIPLVRVPRRRLHYPSRKTNCSLPSDQPDHLVSK